MSDDICPFCGSDNCLFETPTHDKKTYKVHCEGLSAEFFVDTKIVNMNDLTTRYRLYNLIVEKLIRQKLYIGASGKALWFFAYDEINDPETTDIPHYINLAEEMKQYPVNIVEKVARALLNISVLYPKVGTTIDPDATDLLFQHEMFCESDEQEEESLEIVDYLSSQGYIDGDLRLPIFTITYPGWIIIDELTKHLVEIKQGFIAMSYKPECKPILETFRAAIRESGYIAQVIGEKEHNHQIVPEMFFEIERSKFMVVDVTHQNYGAYYEAGYAQALGKEVIVCCSKEVFDNPETRPHFDIAQKAMIVWTDHADLKERLKRRIEATVR